MNIIDERDIRTIHRKLRKKEFDELITLSAKKDKTVRLLDEGMVVTAGGNPDFYIMKGTLQAYFDAIPDDYEGSINLGHMPFANFPILLGDWAKKDLKLVDIGSGRKGLDVTLHLDSENLLVKELKRADYDLGVSAELTYELDAAATEEYGIPMVNKLFIWNFAIVGEAGNVNSSGIKLGGKNMELKEILAMIGDGKDLSAVNDVLDKALETPKPEEKDKEDGKPEKQEEKPAELEGKPEKPEGKPAEEPEKPEEKPKEEPKTEEKEGEKTDLSVVMDMIKGLSDRVKALEAEKDSLEEEKSKLSKELEAKKQSEADFVEKFKKLGVALATESKEPEVEEELFFTDGFGG